MRDREETIAFEMNYCQHYKPALGIDNHANWCTVGVDREAVKVVPTAEDRAKGIFGQPCMGGHHLPDPVAVCPQWIRRTREMGEDRADRTEKSMQRFTLVMPVVKAWRTWTKKNRVSKSEVIECPACKGKLHLSQAAFNGHVHGKCETPDCVSWME
ncbi:MAG: hypothetical protein V4718_04205 [Pseudomonadota bacterium]